MDAKQKTYIEVDYDDLNREVTAAFGQPYEFVADQEVGNDSTHTFAGIDGAPIDNDYDRRKFEEFRITGRGTYLARILLNELCRLGRIGPGDYLIKVSW